MSISADLTRLANRHVYPALGFVDRRWGQILREPPALQHLIEQARQTDLLTPLRNVAEIQGGVVTRANAYFLVTEVPIEEIPTRFRLTKRDLTTVAVIQDGKGTLHACEREFLRPVIKSPESLLGPTKLSTTDLRLFDLQDLSKAELRTKHANRALAYVRRGETVSYDTSEDKLKGGIPSKRSNIRNRKPFWYSLHSPSSAVNRIVVPEHFANRYVATLVPAGAPDVVMDKLFFVVPNNQDHANLLLASLNSELTWYQLEMRGRTQLGQGVLEVKKADWEGVLILNPCKLAKTDAKNLVSVFAGIRATETVAAPQEFERLERIAFDDCFLKACGAADPAQSRQRVEREIRNAASERRERAHSVDDLRAARPTTRRPSASVDAYASKLAANLEPFPDPRTFTKGSMSRVVPVESPVDGTVTVGVDLFSHSDVFCGDRLIASAPNPKAAQYIRGVLLVDPGVDQIELPDDQELETITENWDNAAGTWRKTFDAAASSLLQQISDPRLREEIRQRALTLLHAI